MAHPPSFVRLLYEGSSQDVFDHALDSAVASATSESERETLREEWNLARLIRQRMERHLHREAELTALYETANDLIAIRDVDAILTAIVRRARQLLGADMTYLSLNDEAEGASYMRVTDGSVSAEFRNLRLPLGTGLLGLVAQRGAPYYTDDYQTDQRFVHRDYIDHAVGDEGIRAILGVPLVVEGTVIGALLAGHRSVRAFPPSEVTLLSSFAAHAAVALENARLFEDIATASQKISAQAQQLEFAAETHDRLTDALLVGAGPVEIAEVLADVLTGTLTVYDDAGTVVTTIGPMTPIVLGRAAGADVRNAVVAARSSGRAVELTNAAVPTWLATAMAGNEHLGTLVLQRPARLVTVERRTLERGAVMVALVLLFARTSADAEERVRGELLSDLLRGATRDPIALRERARRQRTDLDALQIVAVADASTLEPHSASGSAARIASDLGGLGGEHDGVVTVIAPGTDALALGRSLQRRLSARGSLQEITVGVAATAPNSASDPAETIRSAWAEARRCLSTLRSLGRTGTVSDGKDLGVARLLLGHNSADDLEHFLTTALGPLVAYDNERGTDLVGTVDAWFTAGGHIAATANALHLHVNTVGQRLERVGRILGADWRSAERSLDLQIALRLHRLQQSGRT